MLIDVFEDEINVQGTAELGEDEDDAVVCERFCHFLRRLAGRQYDDANERCETQFGERIREDFREEYEVEQCLQMRDASVNDR